MALIAWPGTGFLADMRAARAAYLAADVLQNRVIERVRIAEGATYSPSTSASFSEDFPAYGYILSAVETPPAKIAGFYSDLAAIIADLKAAAPSADEMERARNPRLAGILKAQASNAYWLQRLSGSMADPRRLDLIRSTVADYRGLTGADIQAAARRWLDAAKAWRLVIEAPGAPEH
jgi:zinc protease